jgi:GntR family transcriptional regulator
MAENLDPLADRRELARREFDRRRAGTQRRAHANRSIARVYDLVRTYLPRLESGDVLSEAELMESMSSSRNTVRAALQLLTHDGLLTRKSRLGTRARKSLQLPLDVLLPDCDQPAVGMSAEVETHVGIAPSFIQELFGLPQDAAVAITSGLLYAGRQRIGVNAGYVPLTSSEATRARELRSNREGIIDFLEHSLGVHVVGSHSRIGALACDAETAERLGIAQGSPLLWLEMIFVDEDGRDRGLLHARYRADVVDFSGIMQRYAPDAWHVSDPGAPTG